MKRLLVSCLLFLIALHISFAETPRVPANVTIAGIKLKITPDAQREIQKDVNALHASEKYYNIKLDRINLYFPIIERVLREEGVPEDIKFLAVQESSLISDAVSSADAVGYWQFKDFTAREVGLRVDGKIDERKNIVSASRGAAKYFKRNNYFVKNWIYAVSAYQAGPAGVKRYIDNKYVGSDKLVIDKKTHWYAKRFIAHVIAFKDDVGKAHSSGLRLAEYKKGKGKSLSEIAKNLKIEEDQVKQYNKWLKSGKIPDDKTYTVLIPAKGKAPRDIAEKVEKKNSSPPPLSRDTKQQEEKNEDERFEFPDQIIDGELGTKTSFKLEYNGLPAIISKSGDTKSSLAKAAGINKKKLDKFNDLLPGQPLPERELYYLKKKKKKSKVEIHVVQKDETLWSISQRYGVRLGKLYGYNRMSRIEGVKEGRIIYLSKKRPVGDPEFTEIVSPEKEETRDLSRTSEIVDIREIEEPNLEKPEIEKPAAVETKKEEDVVSEEEFKSDQTTYDLHIVVAGETLWAIARKYNLAVDQLLAWNGMYEGEVLSIGQKLQIGAPVEVVLDPEEETKEIHDGITELSTHEVVTGETLYGIARMYDTTVPELLELNGLALSDAIKPGQILKLVELIENETTEKDESKNAEEANQEISIQEHTVSAGETFYSISQKYDIAVSELLEINHMKSTDPLSIGQRLKIESIQVKENREENKVIFHEVKGGDTLYSIAKKYKLTVQELKDLNNKKENTLSVGERLKVNKD